MPPRQQHPCRAAGWKLAFLTNLYLDYPSPDSPHRPFAGSTFRSSCQLASYFVAARAVVSSVQARSKTRQGRMLFASLAANGSLSWTTSSPVLSLCNERTGFSRKFRILRSDRGVASDGILRCTEVATDEFARQIWSSKRRGVHEQRVKKWPAVLCNRSIVSPCGRVGTITSSRKSAPTAMTKSLLSSHD